MFKIGVFIFVVINWNENGEDFFLNFVVILVLFILSIF